MARTTGDRQILKQALKEALVETLQEQREWLHEVFAEVLEDSALAEAIREGQKTRRATRDEVFSALQGAERAGFRGPQVTVRRRGGYEFRSVDRSKADLIVAVDGKPVKTLDDLLGYVESKKPGDGAVMTVVRDVEKIDVPIDLEQARN